MRLQSLGILTVALVLIVASCNTGGSGDPLNGTSWDLASIDGSAAIPGVSANVAFSNGQVSGNSGCNSFGGKYQASGEKLKITELVSTLIACEEPEGIMDQESALVGGLSEAETFRITGDKLEILTSDGKTLAFNRQ